MFRIILSGCNGGMGRVVARYAAEREDFRIVAGVDLNTEAPSDFPVFAEPSAITAAADVLIDFSHPSALSRTLDYVNSRHLPAVIATTGLSPAQIADISAAAADVPIFFSANMSLGVNLLIELCKKAASALGDGFDIEIVEAHHSRKIDAPSGTALAIADAIAASQNEPYHYMYDRHSQRKKRDRAEIGIHSVRGGTIVGEHEVIFAGQDEIITLAHSARSKEIFAVGALRAAAFLAGKKPGLYSMADLIVASGAV